MLVNFLINKNAVKFNIKILIQIVFTNLMDENSYSPTISGEVRWADNGGYCYFHPHPLPIPFPIDDDTQDLIIRAVLALGRLDGKVSHLSSDERSMLTRAFTMKESALSSAIEGTGTTMSDLYLSEIGIETDPLKMADNKEVMNYKKALDLGLEMIDSCGKITEEHMMDVHRTLLEGVRGRGKHPGEFRGGQVFVGSAGDTVDTARFVPPPSVHVPWLMDNWFEYVNADHGNPLLRAAMAHYQFETIHPFNDGNGRMGRLIIMLMLHREGVSNHPVLYISEYFNRHRGEYIDALNGVRERDGFQDWLVFFLRGLIRQAGSSISLIDSLSEYRRLITEGERNMNTVRAMDMLFRNPYVRISDLENSLGVSAPTAGKIVETLEARGILREITGQKRNRIFVADQILKRIEGSQEYED